MMGLGMGGRVQTPLKWHLEYRRQYLDCCGGVAQGVEMGGAIMMGLGMGGTNSIKMAFRIQVTVP